MRRDQDLSGRPGLRLRSGLLLRRADLRAGAGLILAVLAVSALSLGVGETRAGPLDLILWALGAGRPDPALFALIEVRGPRIVLGFLAGACVAVAGAMLQGLARNPLADPGLLGLSQGSMTAILVLLIFAPTAPPVVIPAAALLGGLAVAALLALLTRGAEVRDEGASGGGLALLLTGIAVETSLSAVASILILHTPPETSYAVSDWLAGSLFQASWPMTADLLPWAALLIPAVLIFGRALSLYDLGETRAMALGEPVRRSRAAILIMAVLLTSAAATAAGPLSFLGVMAPQIAGGLSGASGRARLALSALTGGGLVIAADAAARAFGGLTGGAAALPLGLALTLVGLPVFIIALRLRALSALRSR